MKKYSAVFILLLFFMMFANPALCAFVEGMDDVPLPDNMGQITQDDISFGNEETRLLEAYITPKRVGAAKISARKQFENIQNFYKESLPQLGWIYQGNRGNDLLFYREGETLELVKENNSPLLVRITIKTKP